MGEMIDVESELLKDNAENESATKTTIAVIADALRIYAEAAENVRKNGAVVFHPRTGAPIENPYLRILNAQGKVLLNVEHVATHRVLTLLRLSHDKTPESS